MNRAVDDSLSTAKITKATKIVPESPQDVEKNLESFVRHFGHFCVKTELRIEFASALSHRHIAAQTAGGRYIAGLRVVHYHPVGAESPGQRADRVHHHLNPASR